MKQSAWLYAAAGALLLLLTADTFAQPTFINKIPIPPLVDAGSGTIQLEMGITTHKFNPGNPSDTLNGTTSQPNGITTYAYNVAGSSTMTLLGPTLKLHTLAYTSIAVKNLIGVASTTHWHGAEVPPLMDGGPHDVILPGDNWLADFTTLDSASTMWYHPHYHNTTIEHVQKGLSGMIIVEQPGDPIRETLPHTYGVDDIPVIIGDAGFLRTANGDSLVVDTTKGKRPYNLVNGVTNPYLEVPAHVIRLRILNGSTRKGLLVGVSDTYTPASLKQFYLVATDGGYTIKPDTLTTSLTGPGERDEIVLDLSSYEPGDTLYLSNLKAALPNSIIGSTLTAPNGGGKDTTIGTAFLQLRIVPDSQFPGYTPITKFTPFTTEWTRGLADTTNIARHRLKRLVMLKDTVTTSPLKVENEFMIDSLTFDMNFINDTVCVDTKEIWAIQNLTAVAHPFHIHKIQFRILDVKDSTGAFVNLDSNGLNGPKDDVLILPGWTLRFMGQFDDYPSPINPNNTYMYHCHILTHEDSIGGGMMHQFVVADCLELSTPDAKANRPTMVLVSNPAAGTLYLRGASAKPSVVTLYDVQGRYVRGQQLMPFEGNAVIPVSDLAAGTYLVEWRTHNGVNTGKVVVTK